ncbi:MAG: RIP metalloprotease RseP, partial [Ignavibacteriales bacterium]|nr:RIP metalloprotease RseP [Ignavibacteriales bacterium]
MQALNMFFYTAITLGVLIFIHELGHFLAAKLTGMRVDRFSIGFPPRAFGKKIGDTDYCISWLPVGGYVKIAGMVDESMDTDFLEKEPQLWEFRSKSVWARMFVLSAGVIMNVVLALIIFSCIHFIRGKYLQETTEVGYVAEGSVAGQAGIISGDKILSVNGQRVTHWDEIQSLIYIENLGNDITLEVERLGNRIPISIPSKYLAQPSETQLGIVVAHTVVTIDGVEAHMPAEQLGLRAGDTILALNDTAVSYPRVASLIKQHAGKRITLTWKHSDQTMSGSTMVTTEGRIGVKIGGRYVGPSRHISYTFFEATSEGIKEIGQSLHLFFLTVSKIFSGKASFRESFGGPIAIAQLATQSAEYGTMTFLWFMANISMSLAILNILPIPALDGGHLILLLFERVFRREIPHKVKLTIQQVGF